MKNNLFFKAIFCILLVSFALGAGDFIKTKNDVLVSFDDSNIKPISVQEFLKSKHLLNSLNQEITNQEVLNAIIEKRVITSLAKNFELAFSPEKIAEILLQKYSARNLSDMIDRVNLSDEEIIDEISGEYISKILPQVFTLDIPQFIEQKYKKFLSRRYIGDLYRVALDKVHIKTPTESILKEYYLSHSEEYIKPETRSIGFIKISEVSKKVSDAEIKNYYKENSDKFVSSTKYTFIHKVVDTKNKSTKNAFKGIKPQSLSESKIDANILDKLSKMKDLEEKTFEVDGKKHFLKRISYKASQILPIEKVKYQIIKKIIEEESPKILKSFCNQLDDEIAAGASLSDIASRYNLKYSSIDTTKSSFLDKIPEVDDISSEIFKMELNDISQFYSMPNGFIVFEVKGITPEGPAAFNDVYTKVLVDYKKKEARKLAIETLTKISTQMNYNPPDFVIKTSFDISKQEVNISDEVKQLISQGIFQRDPGNFTSILETDHTTYLGFLREIKDEKFSDKSLSFEAKNILDQFYFYELRNFFKKSMKINNTKWKSINE